MIILDKNNIEPVIRQVRLIIESNTWDKLIVLSCKKSRDQVWFEIQQPVSEHVDSQVMFNIENSFNDASYNPRYVFIK